MSSSLQPCRLQPARLLCPWDAPVKNTGVGCHALLQGIFLTHGLNPYCLSLTLAGGFFTTSTTWEAFWLSDNVLYFSKYLNFFFLCNTFNVVNIPNPTVGKRWSRIWIQVDWVSNTGSYHYAMHLFAEICYLLFYYLSRSLGPSLLIEAWVCEITLF